MSALIQRIVLVAEHADPRGSALAFGRSMIAAGGLLVLLFSPDSALFNDLVRQPNGMWCSGVRASALWCLAGSSDHGLMLSRVVSIAVLLLVVSGFSPRWTCIPHWYVTFSLASASPTANGGDSIAQIAAMLLIPVCLGDGRKWQWSPPDSTLPPVWRGSAAAAMLGIRGQIVVIYVTAAASKLMDPFWRNGTALRYVAEDPLGGFPDPILHLLDPLFDVAPLLALTTWSVIGVQVLIAASIAMSSNRCASRIALALGVCLHLTIGALMGLLTFGLIMIGLLIVGSAPNRPCLPLTPADTTEREGVVTAHVHVERFDPYDPGDRGFDGHFQVAVASEAVDHPEGQPSTLDRVITNLRSSQIGFGPRLHWVADVDGHTAAVAFAYFPEAENSHIVLPVITVHPKWRRRGVGAAMLHAMIPEFRSRGRTLVEGWELTKGGSGERWARTLGFQTVKTMIRQCLVVGDVDPARWQADVPVGYHTKRWTNSAPEDLLRSVAVARSAIYDVPADGSDYVAPQWTPAQVREAEAELRDRGVEQRVVAAVHEATGEVVGLTEVRLKPERPEWAFQQDTVVIAAHRGHGLGLCMKSSMTQWLLNDQPQLERFYTGTSAENSHMIRINHQLGYQDVRTIVAVNSDLSSVEAVLDLRTAH